MTLSESVLSVRQIKAARSLLGWSREQTAAVSRVAVPTIEKLESAEGLLGTVACAKIVSALEAAGVEFLHHGRPGVRLKANPPDHAKPVGPATDVIDQMDAAIEAHKSRRSKA